MQKKIKLTLTNRGKQAQKAMQEAVAEVIREHRFKKIPIVVWKNGCVVKIKQKKLP